MKKTIGLFLVVVLVALAVGPVYADQPPGHGPVTYEVHGLNWGVWPGPDEGTTLVFNINAQTDCVDITDVPKEAKPYMRTDIVHPKLNKLHVTGTGDDLPVSVWPFSPPGYYDFCGAVLGADPLYVGTADGHFVANMPMDWHWDSVCERMASTGMKSTGPWSFGANGKVYDAEGGMHHLLFDAGGVYRYPPGCGREVVQENFKLKIN